LQEDLSEAYVFTSQEEIKKQNEAAGLLIQEYRQQKTKTTNIQSIVCG
jgi:hypothetical protein